jgi:SsrA-binding protein
VARSGGATAKNPRGDKTVATNRRARHDYSILETWEAGIVLIGSEVKSLREAQVQVREAYARVDDGDVWLHGMHIAPYPFSRDNPDPDRKRKLLLHRREVAEIQRQVEQQGLTLVPLRVYFTNGLAKVELALAKGKHTYDKRHALAERDAKRDLDRAVRTRSRGGGRASDD